MNIKQIIAENIISLRKSHNLTQNDLALKLNYSDNAVSRWERAEVTPNVETLEQIAELFNIPIETLFQKNALKSSSDIVQILFISSLNTSNCVFFNDNPAASLCPPNFVKYSFTPTNPSNI